MAYTIILVVVKRNYRAEQKKNAFFRKVNGNAIIIRLDIGGSGGGGGCRYDIVIV